MNSIINKSKNKGAFTIVELLTVMSIIVILIGLLVPSLNRVRRYARMVRQKAQFHSIEAAMELFFNEHDGYPPSSALDGSTSGGGLPYCGAMKLCEAMMGQDLMGFHPDSRFRSDGTIDGTADTLLYELPETDPRYVDNLRMRRGPYLPLENANAYALEDLYEDTSAFPGDKFVLCDVYARVKNRSSEGASTIGMPILYYKADTSNSLHDPAVGPTRTDDMGNIYNYWDNQDLVLLGKPSDPSAADHELAEPERFYQNTRNDKITTPRPYRAETFILISAGFDGEYGTADDVCNFDWKYRPLGTD
jgi:type II secretory pathway pseudopilin PulG